MVEYLHGGRSLEAAIALVKVRTRQFAKRQMTWFRREPDVVWLAGFGDEARVQHQAILKISDLA